LNQYAGRIHVIYDDDCAFCVKSASLLRTLHIRRPLELNPSRDWPTVQALIPSLTPAAANEAVYVKVEGGKHYRGFFAIRRLMWNSPATWPLLPLFYLPGAGVLGPAVYGWIARHRHEFGCKLDGCRVPQDGQTTIQSRETTDG